jgi:phosphatidylserine/phosphatidylglycerophosphate/cardiolipin synthase-like enzyme
MPVNTHKKSLFKILLVTLCLVFTNSFAARFTSNTYYDVCFTPGDDCTALIVDEISRSKKSIYVQAYSFTSAAIAKAITDAKNRGIDVKVLLDKSQIKNNRYSSATYLMNQHVPVWIDYRPTIAHNKVMIIDVNTVITGSFNFTKSAQEHNAENVIVIHDIALAKAYLDNWNKRRIVSRAA